MRRARLFFVRAFGLRARRAAANPSHPGPVPPVTTWRESLAGRFVRLPAAERSAESKQPVRSMKLRVASAGGGEASLRVGREQSRGPHAERVRALLLGLAFAACGLLLALFLTSAAVSLPVLLLPPGLASLAVLEPLPGLSWLQVVGTGSGAAATWLLARRIRRSARRRAAGPGSEDLAAQTALVAAWTHKGSSLLDHPAPDDEVVMASSRAPAPPPAAPPPEHDPADPSAAADFVTWGRQAARSGDQHVAQRLLSQAVRLDPNNEEAWLWLGATCEDREDTICCLERVLAINPDNAWARRGLGELRAENRP